MRKSCFFSSYNQSVTSQNSNFELTQQFSFTSVTMKESLATLSFAVLFASRMAKASSKYWLVFFENARFCHDDSRMALLGRPALLPRFLCKSGWSTECSGGVDAARGGTLARGAGDARSAPRVREFRCVSNLGGVGKAFSRRPALIRLSVDGVALEGASSAIVHSMGE